MIDSVHTLLPYYCWTGDRILERMPQLTAEQLMRPFGRYLSPHATLVHLASAEWIWRARWAEGVSHPQMFDPADFPTLADVTARLLQERAATAAYIETLTAAELDRRFSFTTGSGNTFTHTIGETLLHFFNHGTQHFSELALMLTEYGHSPGDIDLIWYLRTR
jgi:uncharacterized damage-inducible protein DinB